MKSLIKSLIVIVMVALLVSQTMSQDLRSYRPGGYVVLYDAESRTGIIYKSSKNTSQLVVLYPSANSAFLYPGFGTHRQTVVDFHLVKSVILENAGAILDSAVSRIIPVN